MNSSGNWTFTAASLSAGSYDLVLVDADGARTELFDGLQIDTSGVIGGGSITNGQFASIDPLLSNDTTPTLSGTADANAALTVSIASQTLTPNADPSGDWSATVGSASAKPLTASPLPPPMAYAPKPWR